MADHPLTHPRKTSGVRFIEADSTIKAEENPMKIPELLWEDSCYQQRSFDLYFGILKLSHSYTMTMEVVFHQSSIHLEAIVDQEQAGGLKLLVTELPQSHSKNRTNFQVEIIIHRDSLSGPFHRTFTLRDTSNSKSVLVNVRGKILREGQGTATLRDGVHMKSILPTGEDDDD